MNMSDDFVENSKGRRRTSKSVNSRPSARRSSNNQHPKPIVDFKQLRFRIVRRLAEQNCQSFYLRFLEVCPDFSEKLVDQGVKLTHWEMIVCAQLKIGFSTKEIAENTRTTFRAVEACRYRIRKKMNISRSHDLTEVLAQL